MELATSSRRAAVYGTAVVAVNVAVNLVHGAAHLKLQIELDPAEKIFVAVVILAGPLAAMALLWTRRQRWGLALLALTMAGSLLFGFYHHFLVMGPDNVASQPPGFWGATFVITSWLLLLSEAAGAYVGVRSLF